MEDKQEHSCCMFSWQVILIWQKKKNTHTFLSVFSFQSVVQYCASNRKLAQAQAAVLVAESP